MITALVRRVLPLFGVAASMAVLVQIQGLPSVDSDAYLHLRLGDEFRAGWSIGSPGHLGVYDSETWLPTQWLSQVAMSWTESVGGMAAAMWLTGTIILLLPACLYLLARTRTGPLPAALATFFGVIAAGPGLSMRPQIVSYVLIAIVTAAWLTTAQDKKPRYWLIPLTWVWVPLHGMWIIGIAIGVAAVIGIALETPKDRRLIGRLALIPALSAVVSLLTPLGPGVYRAAAMVGARSEELSEWAPPDFTDPSAVILAAMIAIVLVAALRSGPHDWPTIMLLGLAIAWAIYSARTTVVAAVMVTPLVASALQGLVPRTDRPGRREVASIVAMFVTASTVLAVIVVPRAQDELVASWMDARLDAMPAGTKVLNDWELGHYVLWRHPQIDLVMHGYVDVFTTEELDRNIEVAALEPNWDRTLARLDVDYALVDPKSRLGYALTDSLGWDEIEGDEDYVLLTPDQD